MFSIEESLKSIWKYGRIIRFVLILLLSLQSVMYVTAQIGIQTNTPDPSSALDISSTDKGLLVPRVTLTSDLTNPSPISNPAESLLIYNSGPNQEQGFYFWNGGTWKMLKPAGPGDVSGPDSSTDNAIARFDGTDGSKIQNSTVILDDAGNVTAVNNINTLGFTMPTNAGDDKVLTTDASGNGTWEDGLQLDIEQSDVLVVPAVTTLNFQGAVTVVDDGNNQATVKVSQAISEEEIIQVGSTISMDVNNLTTPVALIWDKEMFKDATSFDHSNTTDPTRVTVLSDGTYEVNYMFSLDNTVQKRVSLLSRIRKNGTTYFQSSSAYAFSYSKSDDKCSLVSSSFLLDLEAGDYLEILVRGQTNPGAVNTIPDEALLFVRIVRTW